MRATSTTRSDRAAPPPADRGGEELLLAGRYRCGPVIARGAVGEVRYGEDLLTLDPVAVKVLHESAAARPHERRRFQQEASAVSAIDHPNVVRVLDGGEHAGRPYLVMECLPGATFADELTWGPTDDARARRVGMDVLAALDAAHGQGIIHRDVKPANLLVTATAEGDLLEGPVKLADFGIAMSVGADADPSERGAVIGTPAYLSPERLVGGPATYASDLWSVGVVLYEALAGVKPFTAPNRMALAWAIHRGDHVPLAERRPDVDPALADVVERALSTEPADRFPSAGAMAAALDRGRAAVAPGGGPALAGLSVAGVDLDATAAYPSLLAAEPA